MVQYLLNARADIEAKDRFGGTPLDDAVRHDKVEVQALLREHGARLRGEGSAVKICEAAAKGDLNTLTVLVENGVDTALGDYDGRTALHLAASEGQVSVLHYLLDQDPPLDVNCVDRVGGTPLEDAVRHGHSVAAMMLEDAGGVRKQQRRIRDIAARYRQLRAPDRLDMIWLLRWAKVTDMRVRAERIARVNEVVAETPETRAVEGIRGKTLPNLLAVLDVLANRITSFVAAFDAAALPISRALQPRGERGLEGYSSRWARRSGGGDWEPQRLRRSAGTTGSTQADHGPRMTGPINPGSRSNGFGVNGDHHGSNGYGGTVYHGKGFNGGNDWRAWNERGGAANGLVEGALLLQEKASLIMTPRSGTTSTVTTQEMTNVTPFSDGNDFFPSEMDVAPLRSPVELSADVVSCIQALLDAAVTVREMLGVSLPTLRVVRFASRGYRAEQVALRRELRRARDGLRFLRRTLKAAAPLLRAAARPGTAEFGSMLPAKAR